VYDGRVQGRMFAVFVVSSCKVSGTNRHVDCFVGEDTVTELTTYEPQLLFSMHCEITQFAIDTLLKELDYSLTLEKYVEQHRRGYYLKVGGPMRLHDFSLSIADGKGHPSLEITNEFKFYCRVPLLGERQFESLPFKLYAPSVGVALSAKGSKGYAVLHLNSLRMEMGEFSQSAKPRLFDEMWGFAKQSVQIILQELTSAINERLRQEPFELFDLARTQIPLGEGKEIDAQIVFDRFQFEDDKLVAALRFLTIP